MKIRHSVSSPRTKYGETFFIKKLYIGKQVFSGKFMEGLIKGLKLLLKRLQRLIQVSFFLSLTLTWVIDILFEKLTPQIWD